MLGHEHFIIVLAYISVYRPDTHSMVIFSLIKNFPPTLSEFA